MLKKLCFEMRTVTKSNQERDFFSVMSKRRKYADVLPILAHNKSILHMACTLTFLSASACTACTDMVYLKELERGVTTTAMAKAILRLKILAFIPS